MRHADHHRPVPAWPEGWHDIVEMVLTQRLGDRKWQERAVTVMIRPLDFKS
jgi:hypothetical protein